MKRRRCPYCGEDPISSLGLLWVGALSGALVVVTVVALLLGPSW